MSFTMQVTIWCDHPDCLPFHHQGDGESVKKARWEAKHYGWTTSRAGDLCPHHSGLCEGYGRCVECTGNGWGSGEAQVDHASSYGTPVRHRGPASECRICEEST